MGSETPRASVGGADFQSGRPVTSGGELSSIQDSAVVKRPIDLSGIADGLGQVAKHMTNQLSQQHKEEQAARQAMQLAGLTTQSTVDSTTDLENYRASWQSKPGIATSQNYTEGFLKLYDERSNKIRQGISDSKVLQEYDKFNIANRAKFQIAALTQQNEIRVDEFKTDFNTQVSALDDMVRRSPTPDTLKQAAAALDTIYAPNLPNLRKVQGAEEQAQAEMEKTKANLASAMIMQQAAADPDTALASLHNPEINQYIQNPNAQLNLENDINNIKQAQLRPLISRAKDTVTNIMSGLAVGQDVSGLAADLKVLDQKGAVDPAQLHQLQVAQSMSGDFAALRRGMVTMSNTQFEEALAGLNPRIRGGKADLDSVDRNNFYDTAAAALRQQRSLIADNPVSATMAMTGTRDPEQATLQYVHNRLQNGENIHNINVLDKSTAEQLQNRINNAMTSGSVDQVTAIYNEIRSTYGSANGKNYRQIASGVDMADMVLNQLSKTTNSPLARGMLAAYHLIPKDTPLDSHNNTLLRAAMMTNDQRNNLLAGAGMTDRSNNLDALDASLMANNKLWKGYFSPAQPSVEGAQLLSDQRKLLKDALLLEISSGGYKPTGIGWGDIRLGGNSSKDNAINSVLQNYLPYKAEQVSGNPNTGHIQYLRNFGDYHGEAFPITGPLGDLINPITGQRAMIRPKDSRVHFNNSDILLPKGSQLTGDSVRQFVGNKMIDDNYLYHNTRLPGVNDALTNPKVSGNWKAPVEFQQKVNGIAKRLGADPNNLMAVMKIESGFNAMAMNAKTKATGLIQWMTPPTGQDHSEFAKTPALQQLDHVENWFSRFKGKLTSPGRTYLAVAAPGVLSRLSPQAGPETVIYSAGSKEAKSNPLWQDAKGNVTLGKLDALVTRAKQGAGVTEAPRSIEALPIGNKLLFEQKMKMARQNLSVKNTEDLNGVRIYTVQNGREIPIARPDGSYLEFSFDDIARGGH